MSKRNVAWLIVVVGVGVLVGINAGVLWGIFAAAVALTCSEMIERARRKRRRAARGVTGSPSLSDAVNTRRKRR
jgi:hypothetical protein